MCVCSSAISSIQSATYGTLSGYSEVYQVFYLIPKRIQSGSHKEKAFNGIPIKRIISGFGIRGNHLRPYFLDNSVHFPIDSRVKGPIK